MLLKIAGENNEPERGVISCLHTRQLSNSCSGEDDSGDSSEDEMEYDEDHNNAVVSLSTSGTYGIDCTVDFCETQLADNLLQRYKINVPEGADSDKCEMCTISFEVVYDGEAWVSIAFSDDGKMIGSDAVIGIPSENGNIPQKYYLGGNTDSQVQPMPQSQQTLTDASVQVSNGQTVMKFTKILDEPDEIEIKTGDNNFLWAYGSSTALGYHSARASYIQNLSTGSSEVSVSSGQNVWLDNGIMAFIAWGMLVPFAVQSSLLHGFLPNGPLWFQLHRAFNTISYALTIAVFGIAVAYYNREGEDHFDDPHPKMGLAILIGISAQVLGGVLRPHAPNAGEAKEPVRAFWEIGHHLVGVTLLACSFWQIFEGIDLYAKKFNVKEDGTIQTTYLVWIGLMSLIIVGGVFFKLCRTDTKPPESTAAAPNIEIA